MFAFLTYIPTSHISLSTYVLQLIYEEIFLNFLKSLDLDTYRYFMIFLLYFFLPWVSLCLKGLNKPYPSEHEKLKTHPWILPPFTLDHQLWIGEFEFEYKIEKAAARVRDLCRNLFISKQWIICFIAMSPLNLGMRSTEHNNVFFMWLRGLWFDSRLCYFSFSTADAVQT